MQAIVGSQGGSVQGEGALEDRVADRKERGRHCIGALGEAPDRARLCPPFQEPDLLERRGRGQSRGLAAGDRQDRLCAGVAVRTLRSAVDEDVGVDEERQRWALGGGHPGGLPRRRAHGQAQARPRHPYSRRSDRRGVGLARLRRQGPSARARHRTHPPDPAAVIPYPLPRYSRRSRVKATRRQPGAPTGLRGTPR